MNANQTVRHAMSKKGLTQKALADKLGMKNQSGISEKLRSTSMGVESFIKLMNGCGYDIIARDRWTQEEIKVEVE